MKKRLQFISEIPLGFANEMVKPPHWPEDAVPTEGVWRDYYTGEKLDDYHYPWQGSHPNYNGNDSNCLRWCPDRNWTASWMESDCLMSSSGCPCEQGTQAAGNVWSLQGKADVLFRLRGICPNSLFKGADRELGSRWTVVQDPNLPNSLFFMSGQTARIDATPDGKFEMTLTNHNATAFSWSERQTYVLGLHSWTVTSDHRTCHPADGSPVTTQWMFSACKDGQYTCNDGHCISMEQRCNQLTDCADKSDEIDCNMLVISSGYSKMVAPIKLAADKSLIPVTVDVSLQLLKIVEIEEENHAIDFQYEIIMAWKDHRVDYHNLKEDTSLNALREIDIKRIWLPLVRAFIRSNLRPLRSPTTRTTSGHYHHQPTDHHHPNFHSPSYLSSSTGANDMEEKVGMK